MQYLERLKISTVSFCCFLLPEILSCLGRAGQEGIFTPVLSVGVTGVSPHYCRGAEV